MKASRRELLELYCNVCGRVSPHRTASVKVNRGGVLRWFQLYRVCTGCLTLNPIYISRFRLKEEPEMLQSQLAKDIVARLRLSRATLSDLVRSLRSAGGMRSIAPIDVRMALDHLIREGNVEMERFNETNHVIRKLREMRAGSRRLGRCPSEVKEGSKAWSLVSLYVQRRKKVEGRGRGSLATKGYASVGIYCVNCGHHELRTKLIATCG